MAASRVVWFLARNPGVAQTLMGCNLVYILFQGLTREGLTEPLPLLGARLNPNV